MAKNKKSNIVAQTAVFTKGQKVICNGYDGTVHKICDGTLSGMIEVRVPGGLTCVCAQELARFNDEKYRAGGAWWNANS